MRLQRVCRDAIVVFLVLSLTFLAYNLPFTSNEKNSGGAGGFAFFSDYDEWIDSGYLQYNEFSANNSFTAEVVVGIGERYESIQEALNDGYLCLYLKRQIFEISEPIVPPQEDFYIIGDGAEIIAVQPVGAIFDVCNVRYARFDGLFINGNGLAQKCIDASRTPSQVPVHQIRNCKVWGARIANIDFAGCGDSLMFNCWIDGRKDTCEPPLAITEYGVKIGDFGDGYRTGGQINLIHCLMGFHRKADVFEKTSLSLSFQTACCQARTCRASSLKPT